MYVRDSYVRECYVRDCYVRENYVAPSDGQPVSERSDLNFKGEPKITGPITRAIKKLLDQQRETELVISVLCDLSKLIAQYASGNMNVQTIHYYLTKRLPANTVGIS
jgi:hypothetical protein